MEGLKRSPGAKQIVFVCPWFGVFAGGAERAVRTLARELGRRGSEVSVLTTCCGDLYGDWSLDTLPAGPDLCEGIPVHRFPLTKGLLDRYREAVFHWTSGRDVPASVEYDFFRCGIGSDELVASIASLPPSAAVVACPYFQSLTYRALTDCPGRVHLLGAFHDEAQFHWRPVGDMLRRARGVLFLSEEEKDLAIRVYGHAVGRGLVEAPVVGLGCELDPATRSLLRDPERSRSIRQGLGIPEMFFLALGRKEAGKGVRELVEWYRAYADGRRARGLPEVPLVLVGDGDASLVPDAGPFRSIGFVGEEEKFSLLWQARATLNLSPHESFSFVVMESWLCGTPVVVSADSEVTTGHCFRSAGGYAVRCREDFCAALAAFEDPELADLAGAAGRAYVAQQYDWDSVADRFLRALAA